MPTTTITKVFIMGNLTTHILDTAHGCPAAGVHICVRRIIDGAPQELTRAVTNADGRCDKPLVAGDAFTAGQYEIIFAVGPYFAAKRDSADEPRFLDDVVIRFGIAHADQHYHVPLLVAPFAYSTYRGS